VSAVPPAPPAPPAPPVPDAARLAIAPTLGRCGHELPPDAPGGVCPRCALTAALGGALDTLDATGGPAGHAASATSTTLPPLAAIGEYELQAPIARGGMGVVYRARHKTLGRTVALKMLIGGLWANDDERARFRAEAELAASLEHENIVPIYEVGEHDGQPYYAMRLMEESLSAHVERRGRLTPLQAAALVATIARAVHFGHRHGVVHRDLKPANLLLDAAGRPHVGDFGVSRRLAAEVRRRGLTATGAIVGTPGYMAPEQAGAFGGDLTIAVDIWGLGAVLYELLCGAPPFTGATAVEAIRKLLDEEPAPPRRLRPELDRDLETVCLKCLEKQPERRYASALDLALDLERVGRGEPVQARRLSRRERLQRLWRRYPWRAGAAVSAVIFLAALAIGSTLAARAQEQELVDELLHTNAWVARSMAGAVDLELWKLRAQVGQLAADERFLSAVEHGELGAFVAPLHEPFDSFLFLDEQGICRARWPSAEGFVGRDLSFRDYAQRAAAAPREQTVVSSAFYSKADGTVRFAVAAPVYVEGRRAGVLAATLRSDSTFGSLSLTQDAPTARRFTRKVILLARHGAELASATGATDAAVPAPAPEEDWMILVHPELPSSGAKAFVDAGVLARLQRAHFDPQYRDSLAGADRPMLAGYAAVGDAPFAVVVETPAEHAVAPNARWVRRVGSAGALAGLMGVVVLLSSLALSRRPRPRSS
jgi:eukaryotic-like serine/threonine-protein kinase